MESTTRVSPADYPRQPPAEYVCGSNFHFVDAFVRQLGWTRRRAPGDGWERPGGPLSPSGVVHYLTHEKGLYGLPTGCAVHVLPHGGSDRGRVADIACTARAMGMIVIEHTEAEHAGFAPAVAAAAGSTLPAAKAAVQRYDGFSDEEKRRIAHIPLGDVLTIMAVQIAHEGDALGKPRDE